MEIVRQTTPFFSYYSLEKENFSLILTTSEKNFNLGLNVDYKVALSNWKKIKRYFGVEKVGILQQIHSNIILENELTFYKKEGDGIILKNGFNLPSTLIGVTVADCLPLLGWDKEEKNFFTLHVGWRGLYSGILDNLKEKIENISNYCFFLGPSARSCCYEVGKELYQKFEQKFPFLVGEYREGKFYLDIPSIVKNLLSSFKVPLAQIFDFNYCTICQPEFFSYRREKNKAGRFSAFVLIK